MDLDVSKLTTKAKYDINKLFVSIYLTNGLDRPSFKGFAKSVSTNDEKGPFDVLPGHENFVAKIGKGLDVITEAGEKVHFDSKSGVVEVADNIVRVFLDN